MASASRAWRGSRGGAACTRAGPGLAGGAALASPDPAGPLPPLTPSNAARARQERIIAMGKRGMTIRQIGRVLAMSQSHRVLWGTPKSIADDLHEWLGGGAARRLHPL